MPSKANYDADIKTPPVWQDQWSVIAMKQLKIFLSSTMVDLAEPRQKILKYLQVLPSDVISMEVFGSDESKPKEFCLNQVRQCNLFIGIYAERYGTIDDGSNLSLTELEYNEASDMLKSGRLMGLLIYMINPDTSWPLTSVDRDPINVQKLAAFKKNLAMKHTITFFKVSEDLPFLVLRDVIRKCGIGVKKVLRPKIRMRLAKRINLDRPIGMEYYSEELSLLFSGRGEDTDRLLNQVINNRMSLLIGASGIGKTSLICAGLFSKLHELGWRTALIRPLTDPIQNLCKSLWGQLMKAGFPSEFDFPAVAHSVANAHTDTHVLIVIDQFEDILGSKPFQDIESVTRSLFDLYTSAEGNLRFLISYRGDIEAQIGSMWQKVSGSAEGLPRSYLGALNEEGCGKALDVNFKALGISLSESSSGKEHFLKAQIIEDLARESMLSGFTGIYPPFLQMIISRANVDADIKREYKESFYVSGGRCRRIISDYLLSQLKYLGKNRQKGQEVLISLVSSYGTKSQKTIDEISAETLHKKDDVEKTLRSLIDLRIVRAINDHFEIVHDFLAKTVVADLVSSDEREAKKFKELLASRAAAYPITKAILTRNEHIYIYKYRNKILCTEDEVRLLLASYLAGNGPIHYWLRSYPKDKVANWARSALSDNNEDVRRNIYRFLVKSGEEVRLSEIVELFSDYKLKSELGELILKLARPGDISLLLKLHRKKGEEVKDASEKALIGLVSTFDERFFGQLGKSNTQSSRRLFELLSFKLSQETALEDIRNMWKSHTLPKRMFCIYGFGKKGRKADLERLQDLLKDRKLGNKYKLAIVKSLVRILPRYGKGSAARSLLMNGTASIKRAILESLETTFPELTLEDILLHYEKYPRETARAVRRLTVKEDLSLLKKVLKTIELNPPARELVLAVCDKGGENEFDFLWRLFTSYGNRIDFWNAPALFRAMANRAGRKHLAMLTKLIEFQEFWEYYAEDKRPRKQIPAVDFENVYFIRRLIGITYARVAGRNQFEKLVRLLGHNYWIISNAAADAIIRFAKTSDIARMIEEGIQSQMGNDAIIKVLCSLDESFERGGSGSSSYPWH